MFIPLAVGWRRNLDHYSFASFVLGFAFDSALTYLLYRRSAEADCSSVGMFSCWFFYGFAESRVCALAKALFLSRKGHASVALVEDRVFPVQDFISSFASVHRCSMTDAVVHAPPSTRYDQEVWKMASTLPTVVDAYDVDVDTESDSDLSDILASSEIYIPSSLCVDFIAIYDKCVKQTVEVPRHLLVPEGWG